MRKMIVKRVSILFVNRIDERLAASSSISPRVAFSTSLINAVSMATASPVKWPKFLIDHINIIHIKHCYHVEIEKYREEKSFRRWANWCTTPPYLQERCWCLNCWCWKLWLRKRRKISGWQINWKEAVKLTLLVLVSPEGEFSRGKRSIEDSQLQQDDKSSHYLDTQPQRSSN